MARKTSTNKQAASPSKARTRVMADFRNAALIVSVTLNLAIIIGWLVLKVTSEYDYQVARFLFL